MRWRSGVSFDGTATYKIGVVDGGFEAHGDALVAHMNQYYFNDELNIKDITEKSVDFIVITHPDQDHTIGIKKVLENFSVKKIYMNRPWKYVDDLFDKVNDGRITKESLARRLREKYKTIADIEDMAKEKNIPIYEAFEGAHIEDELLILSPEKQYYLSLLVSSEKTPLEMSSAFQHDGTLLKFLESVKDFALNILVYGKSHILYCLLCVFKLFVTGFTTCQHFDTADFSLFQIRTAIVCNAFCFAGSTTAATSASRCFLFFFLFLSKVK